MLYNHFTEELLGLQGVKITNVEQEENLIIHLEKKNRRNFPKHIEDILKTLKSYCWKDLINQKTNSNSRFWLCQKLLWTLAGLIGTRKNSLKYLTAAIVKPPRKMQKWIYNASNCGIPQFEKCAHSMQNRLTGILNSFSSPYTNGFTEGCNNKIKVLKRNAYGYKNFRRFRTAYKAFLNWRVSNTKWSPILSEFQNINQYAVNE